MRGNKQTLNKCEYLLCLEYLGSIYMLQPPVKYHKNNPNAHTLSFHQQTQELIICLLHILSFFLFRSKTHHMLRRRFLKHLLQTAEWDVKLLNAPVLLQVLFSVRRPQSERRWTSVLSFFQHLGSISWLSFHCSGNQIFQPPPREQRGPLLREWTEEERHGEREEKRAREGCGGRTAWHNCGV